MQTLDELRKQRKADPEGFFNSTKKIIEENTEIVNDHFLTPELTLRLSTPKCWMYTANPEEFSFPDPYWAYYWLGGQGLARYVLDNKNIVRGKTVLDLGSGCGALAIAAAKLGNAASITANDIDPVAAVAVEVNASLNSCKPKSIKISTDNIVLRTVAAYKYDVILVGDMFYNEKFNITLMDWLLKSLRKGVTILIGDPIRHSAVFADYKENLKQLTEYPISAEDKLLNQLDNDTINIFKLCYEMQPL